MATATAVHPPAAPAAARRRDRWLTPAACLAAALPAIVSTVRGIVDGYTANGDRGVIAIRAYDVFSTHPPLTGQFSASSLVTGKTVHSPGPLLYWLLAPAAHIGGGETTLALTMGLVNAAALAGAVLLARRRGGVPLMLAAALALALMCRSLPAETFHDIFNPAVGVIPLSLLFFVGWSVACGDYRLLPLAVLVASFAAQAELTFVLPSAAPLLVGVVGLVACRRRLEGRVWPWVAGAVAVGLVCWAPPLVDELTHRNGNLSLIAQTATTDVPTVGTTLGWHAVVRAVGIPPWWLRIPTDPFYMLGDVQAAPGTFSIVTAVVVLLGLVGATIAGVWRRRSDIASATALSLLLLVALLAVAASTPSRSILMSSLGYTLWWAAPAGMFAWLALGFAATAVPRPSLGRAARYMPATGAATAVAVGAAVAAAERPGQDRPEYGPLRTAIARVDAAVPARTGTVKVGGTGSWTSFDFQAGIAYQLRRRGLRPIATWAAKRTGLRYSIDHRYRVAVFAWNGRAPHPTDRVLARVPLATANDGVVTVTYAAR